MTDTPLGPPGDSLLDPESFSSYQIRNPREIHHLIQALQEKRVLLNAYIDGGPFSFITAVLGFEPEDGLITLDASPDPRTNERAALGDRLACTGRLDGVRIQFSAANPERIPLDGLEAIRCTLPDMMLRLQRRESYRQPVPMSSPVTCSIRIQHTDGTAESIDVRVLDISNDGIGIIASSQLTIFEAGKVFENCVLNIPDAGTTDVVLKLRNVYRIQNRLGGESLRAGCEFIDLPNRIVTQIQRYIYKIDRERRLLETNR